MSDHDPESKANESPAEKPDVRDELDKELDTLAERAEHQPDHEPARSTGPGSLLRIVAGFLVLGLFAVGGVLAWNAMHAKPPPTVAEGIGAKLELAAGEVVLVGEDEQTLLSGTPLPVGAKLETRQGARALVRLADGSRIFMRDQSVVELAADTGVTVTRGEVWLETPPLDRNREPLIHKVGAAELVLTDGGASLALTDEGARIYVAEGSAAVTSPGGRTEVRSGEQALIAGDTTPSVEAVAFWDDWTGGMADRRAGGRIGAGSGALYAVDKFGPPGAKALPLQISRQTVDVAIEDGLAETRVDQRFFNPSERDVEGWYWFTIPENSMLVGFALETDGVLVEGEIVERKQAVATYERAVVSDDNPALLEWIDERTVRARIYPVPAMGERRVVVRYQQLLSESEGKLRYSYPLAAPAGHDAITIEEFSLALELREELARDYAVSTSSEAKISQDNRLITMRRSGFTPRADFELELTRKGEADKAPALRLTQFEPGKDQARFVMLRWLPDLDPEFGWADVEVPAADVVVVVDTSAFGDAAEHQSRKAIAEALLRSLAEQDRFTLMAADLTSQVLFPSEGLSEATPDNISKALAALDAHRPGGASDLGSIFERALERVHGSEQPAIVYVGDGLATSGDRSSDALAERLRRALTGSRARLFTIGVGAQLDDRLLERLARVGGGRSLRVEAPEQAIVRALELSGAIKTPTITDLELELGAGLDDRFDNATGKLARGEELVILARTHHDLPKTVTIRGRRGGQAFEKSFEIEVDQGVLGRVVPKLWAAAQVERLLGDGRGPEAVRGKVLSLGLEYGLMTPFTSFLALDSESAYARQGVERRRRPWDFKLLAAVLPSELPFEERRPDYVDQPGPGELLIGALGSPFGCTAAAPKEEAPARNRDTSAASSPAPKQAEREEVQEEAPPADGDDEVAGQGYRHKGEEGKMGKPSSRADSPYRPEPEPDAVAAAEPPPPPGAAPVEEQQAERGATGFIGGSGGGGAPKGGTATGSPARDLDKDTTTDTLAGFLANNEDGEAFAGDDPGAELPKKQAHEEKTVADQKPKPTSGESKRRRSTNWRPQTTSWVERNRKLPCSDASARSLAQRKILWEQRLAKVRDMTARLDTYEAAAGSCELDTWREEQVFLQMLQASANTEAELELLIAHFWDREDAREFVVRSLLRRLVDPQLIATVERTVFGPVDWELIDAEVKLALTEEDKLAALQAGLDQAPNAPEGELRMLDLLAALGRTDEAIARGRRLRDRGQMTPVLAERLGELLVAKGEDDEAKRVFSEIVEYDPAGETSRRMLGDIFLRHGWYQEAYEQYEDLLARTGEPSDAIRMARAAAGVGRIDEALRLLRKVANGEGRPGVDDPRRWARLHAAALLAQLLATDKDVAEETLERELKRLQLFDAPTTWTLVLWQDLDQSLTLGPTPLPEDATPEQKQAAIRDAARVGDALVAGDTGLWAIERGGLSDLQARHSGVTPAKDVAFERLVIRFDGSGFEVERTSGTIVAKQTWQGGESKGEPEPAPSEGEDEPAEPDAG